MLSTLRRDLVYRDISPDIVEHDNDIDADQWSYDNRDVYRGSFDPRYTEYDLNVYWLYDDNLKRVGLAEHEVDDPSIFEVLWFRENPFATLYQNSGWKSKEKTLWSILPHEAYADCLEDDFTTIFDRCLTSKYRLITPSMILDEPTIYECQKCKKQSLSPLVNCKAVNKKPYFKATDYIFIDDSFIMYEPPKRRQSVSSEPPSEEELSESQPEEETEQLQKESVLQHPEEQVIPPLPQS